MFVRLTLFFIALVSITTCKSISRNTQVKQDDTVPPAETELLTPTIWIKAMSYSDCQPPMVDNCDVRILPLQTEAAEGSEILFSQSVQDIMRQSIISQINAAMSAYATSAANTNSNNASVTIQEMEARIEAIDIDALVRAVLSPAEFNHNSITWNATVGDFALCEPSATVACTGSGNGAGGGSSIIYDQADFTLALDGITMDPAETIQNESGAKKRSGAAKAGTSVSGSLGTSRTYPLSLIYNVRSTLDAGMKIDLVKFLGNLPAFGRLKNWIMGNFGDMLSAGFQFSTVNSTSGFQFTEFKPLYNGLSEFQINLLYDFLPEVCEAVVRKESVWTDGFNCPTDSEGIVARLGSKLESGATIQEMINLLKGEEWDASVRPILDNEANRRDSGSTTIVSDSATSSAAVTVPVAATEAETFINVIHNEEAFLRAQKCEFFDTYAWIYFAAPVNYKASYNQPYGQFSINERQNQFGNQMSWSRQHSDYGQKIEQATDQSYCPQKGGKNPTCYRVKLDWAWTNEEPLCDRINSCAGLASKRSIVAIVKSGSQQYPQFDEFSSSNKSAAEFISCQ